MSEFARLIRPYVDAELQAASVAESQGDPALAFSHLDRAHVLGQASTTDHVRVHLRMLVWGWHRRDAHQTFGQVVRIVGAATKTALGLVLSGNTGGANVSPLKPLPVADDLAAIIARVRGAVRS